MVELLEDRRAIASLVTVKGFQLLIDKVVKCKERDELTKLKLADGQEKLEAAYKFCAWNEVVELLENTPKQLLEVLKDEGDPIYG